MKPHVLEIEIKYESGALLGPGMITRCDTRITSRGKVRTIFTFNAGPCTGGDRECLPVREIYEYALEESLTAGFFASFDWLTLQPAGNDQWAMDGGSWQMKIKTADDTIRLSGHEPPTPFGEELEERISRLIRYRIPPVIFS